MPQHKRAISLTATGHVGPIGGTGAGARLHKIIVGTATATAVVTVYDGQDTTGTVIATIDASAIATHHFDGVWCKNGIYVNQTTAAAKITVVYE